MNSYLLQALPHVPHEYLGVYIFLVQRAEAGSRVGVTQQEVSRHTRLSVPVVREALGWLESPVIKNPTKKDDTSLPPFLSLKRSSSHYKIRLLVPYVDKEESLNFTFEDKDQTRIQTLEKELQRLASAQKEQRSLSSALKGIRAQVVAEIETDLGRNLTIDESFMLGGVVAMFGPERLKASWRTKAHEMKNPVRDITAMFFNRAFGKPIKREEVKDISYRRLGKGEE